jgi:hypothetical protein
MFTPNFMNIYPFFKRYGEGRRQAYTQTGYHKPVIPHKIKLGKVPVHFIIKDAVLS